MGALLEKGNLFVVQSINAVFPVQKYTGFFLGGDGGGRRPPPDFGGKRVPPRGGTHFDLGKKGYGDTTYVTRTRKKREAGSRARAKRVLSPSWHHCEEDIAR